VAVDLSLTDDEFRNFDNTARGRVFDAIRAAEHRGLAIAAPPVVDTRTHGDLPLLVASSVTALDAWTLELPRRTTLVVLDPERDEIYEGAAFPPIPGLNESELRTPSPPAHPNATAVFTEASCLDLRSQLSLPWGRCRLVVHALCFDRLSNPAAVSLLGPDLPPPTARLPLPLPDRARLGALSQSPLVEPGSITFASGARRSIEDWEAPLAIAAPGPTLTVLAAVQRERSLLRRTIDLEGQPYVTFDLRTLFRELHPEFTCFYLASAGSLAGPFRVTGDAARPL
jgi:hypothetical protein